MKNEKELKQAVKELNQFEQFLRNQKSNQFDAELLVTQDEFDELPDLADSTDYNLNVFTKRS